MIENTNKDFTYTEILKKIKIDVVNFIFPSFSKERFVELEDIEKKYKKLLLESEVFKESAHNQIANLNKMLEENQELHSKLKEKVNNLGINADYILESSSDMWEARTSLLLNVLIEDIYLNASKMEVLMQSNNPKIQAYLSSLPSYDKDLLEQYFKNQKNDELTEKATKILEQHSFCTMGLYSILNKKDSA